MADGIQKKWTADKQKTKVLTSKKMFDNGIGIFTCCQDFCENSVFCNRNGELLLIKLRSLADLFRF